MLVMGTDMEEGGMHGSHVGVHAGVHAWAGTCHAGRSAIAPSCFNDMHSHLKVM